MTLERKIVLVAASLFFGTLAARAQNPSSAGITAKTVQGQEVSISEPAPVKLGALFKQADLVAILRIVSGDTEHYSTAMYKAFVVEAFKGAKAGQTIFFGPFLGYGLGGEYVAFLSRDQNPKQSHGLGPSYGRLAASYSVMYDGYSTFPIEYACAFDKAIAQQCDYGVQLNVNQVFLPHQIRTFPLCAHDAEESRRWVRRKALLALIESFGK